MKSPMERLNSGETITIDGDSGDVYTLVRPNTVWLVSHCCSALLNSDQVKKLHAALGAWLRKNKDA